nr:hypothetical protein 5 [Balneolaceae bacterium]
MSDQSTYNEQDRAGSLMDNIKQLKAITEDYQGNSFVENTEEFFSTQVYADFLRSYTDDENIIRLLAPYLDYFQARDISDIVNYVQGNEGNLTDEDRRDLFAAFSVFGEDTTELETLYAKDFVRRIFVDNQDYYFDIIQPGEDIVLSLTLPDGADWGGHIIAARLDVDNSLLSDGSTMGQPQTVQAVQTLDLGNITLADNTLHKILITLEEKSGGSTTGERIKVLGHYYLVVQNLNKLVT